MHCNVVNKTNEQWLTREPFLLYNQSMYAWISLATKWPKFFNNDYLIFSLKFQLERCLLANFCRTIFFWLATSKNHSDYASLWVLISSPVILEGLLCASGDTQFLNASEFSSVFGKWICHFLFLFATRSLIYWAPRLSQLFQLKRNWPFPSSKNSHFRNKAKFKTFLVKMKFIRRGIKNRFQLSMALH